MRLRYDTKRSPLMSSILIVICIALSFIVFQKIDLTSFIFGEIGRPEPVVNTMSKAQYAEVLRLSNQQNSIMQAKSSAPILHPPNTNTQIDAQSQMSESGAIYQYTDASGTVVMVDNIQNVPMKYREGMKTSSGNYGQQRTAVTVQNNQVWVPVTFSHKGKTVTARLLLDTGATNITISPAVAQHLGIQSAETINGKATLADGSMVQTASAVIDQVSVGPKAKWNLNVHIMSRTGDDVAGLLGMNFLGDFPHSLDAKSGFIRWQ